MNYMTVRGFIIPSVENNNYWSSTANADNTNNAWGGYFNNGYTYNIIKDSTILVLCIHE